MSVNCVTPLDDYMVNRLLDNFEIQKGVDNVQLLAHLETFLYDHQSFFDRFIFVYLPDDWQVFLHFFPVNLSDKHEQEKRKILFPLLFSSFPQDLIDQSSYDESSPLFNYIEDQDRIIQLIGFTFEQFLEYVSPRILDEVPTCVVLINLDQVCYNSLKFVQIGTKFLPKLSKYCAYLGLTKRKINGIFYQFLAQNLRKKIILKNFCDFEVPNYNNWTFTTLLKEVSQWFGDPSLPKKFHNTLLSVRDGLPDLTALTSDSSVEEVQRTIQRVKKETFGIKNWHIFRRFAYALFLGDIFSRTPNKKTLIITESFTRKSWKTFQKKMGFPEYKPTYTPQFRFLSLLNSLSSTYIKEFDHVILDLGDELTEWISSPQLLNILEKVKLVSPNLTSIPVTFFHPYSISSDAMEWFLSNPPIPLSLAELEDLDRTDELIYRTILLTTRKRITKRELYQKIRASWLQVHNDLDSDISLTDEIKYLRLIGLFEKVHYHTTPLGKFFLEKQFSITSFLKFLKKQVPTLFVQNLSEKMPVTLFIQFFYACAAWYYYEKPDDDFDDLEWVEYRQKVIGSGKIYRFCPEIEDKIDDMISEIRENNLSEGQFKVKNYSKSSLIKSLLEEIEYQTEKPSKALIWALYDILMWMKPFKNEKTPIPSTPYFLVRQHAHRASWQKEGVSEASYVRAIRRIFDEKYSHRDTYFVQQPSIPGREETVPHAIRRLRHLLKIKYIKLTNNRGSQVVIFRSSATHNWKNVQSNKERVLNFPWNFEYLNHSCKECVYFNSKRKRHCSLLSLYEGFGDLPEPCSDRTNITYNQVFSNMVGCPIWRPRGSVSKESGQPYPKYCYHCFQKITRVRGKQKIICQCGTEYQLLLDNQTQEYNGFTYYLTPQYEKFQEKAILFPDFEITIDIKEKTIELPAKYRFQEINYEEFLQLKGSSRCLQIQASDKISYAKDLDKLEITNRMGKPRYIDSKNIDIIDTPYVNEKLLEFIQKHPQVLINHRSKRLTLSRKFTVNIKRQKDLIPVLQVRRKRVLKNKQRLRRRSYRARKPESIKNYPLNEIYSVFNVGKPRLNQTLRQYGVTTIYAPTRGITSEPIEKIEEALGLEGVRQTLSEIHLLGLIVSVLRASAQLIGITYHLKQPEIGDKIKAQVNRLLMESPRRLYQHYQPLHLGYYPSLRKQCQLEGWMFRPFAEGIRELIISLPSAKKDGLLENISQQRKPREGRIVTRRVQKKNKKERDFYGGYSPFDSALNSIHRPMRYQLRLKNARIGFGFNTIPIFSHRAHDKPGRSGHLDLEEVARILSRFVVLEGVYKKELSGKDFEICLDDKGFPYYVPYYRTLAKIRSTFFYKNLFTTPIYYDGHWLPLEETHRIHVKHLRKCLEKCNKIDSEQARQNHLLKTYQPLIYHVKPFNQQVSDIKEEFFYLLDYSWVKRTYEIWKRLGINPQSVNHFLFNAELVKRISSI